MKPTPVRLRYLPLALCLLVTFASWADEPRIAKRQLIVTICGGVPNVHAFGEIYLTGQPDKGDFNIIKAQRIKTILNLRESNELDWNEGEYVKQLGIEYVHLPFRSPESLTDDVFAKSRALLKDVDKRPILVHCASANRVGAVWLVHQVLDGGLPYDEALTEAKTVGLKSGEYEAKARDYIERILFDGP